MSAIATTHDVELGEHELPDAPAWAVEMYRRFHDGAVLSVEEGTGTVTRYDGYKVVILPENFEEDNDPIHTVGEFVTLDAARAAVRDKLRRDYE